MNGFFVENSFVFILLLISLLWLWCSVVVGIILKEIAYLKGFCMGAFAGFNIACFNKAISFEGTSHRQKSGF